MGASFWTNTVWYAALGLTVPFEVAFTLRRAENRRQAAAFYITLVGMTLWLETALLIFFEAYAYRPAIITDPAHVYDDILAGNLFSQFSIAASMLMAAVLRLKPLWYAVIALAYGAVEELFIALGVYEHNWYFTWITVALLPFALLLARKMYDRLREGLKPAYYYVYIFFSLFPLTLSTLFWGLHLAGIQTGNDQLLADPETSRYTVILCLHIAVSSVLLLAYFAGLKWRWKVLAAAALEALFGAFYAAGLLIIRPGWFLPASASYILWTYASIALMDRLYGLGGIPALKL